MKVRMLKVYASPTRNVGINQVVEVSDAEGAELVKGNYAEEVKDPNVPAKKRAPALETADAPRAAEVAVDPNLPPVDASEAKSEKGNKPK